ncbi:MAG: MFS transporter [Bacteroidota bacterium]|nr:MFS transporter [Bacteroidota bacterium]
MNINTFKSFKSRNYRLYFSGQSVSLIGTWMQRTAVYWLIYDQTHSAFMLGLAVFAAQFPSFLFSPLGGVVSDRYNRYRVLLITQAASLIQATVLTLMVIFTHYTVTEILVLSVVLGTINAFDVPARQSMVNEMVGKEDLSNAIALNSSMVNLARLIGPAISGIVLQKLGAGTCFLINALSFLAVIASLLFMRFPKFISHSRNKKVIGEFKEGLKYLQNTPSIGFVILMLACVSLLVLPFVTLLPVYAKVIFKGNAATFGYLNSAIGLGAIGGAFFLASLKPGVELKTILFINLLIFGTGLMLFSHVTNLPVALFFAMVTGFGMMSQTTVSNTIIQTKVSAEMRGRAISYFAMAFFGMLPLGGLLVGTVSQYIGAPNTILAEGIAAVIIAVSFLPFLRKDMLRETDKIKLVELEDATVHVAQ